MTPILPPFIDSTMLTCFRSCPRKFYNEFVLGLRPPGISHDLHAGGAFAAAIEAYRRAVFGRHLPDDEAQRAALAAFLVYWGDYEVPEHKKTAKSRERMWEAVEEYISKFPPLTDHVQPYAVDGDPTFEFTFAIPLEPAVQYSDIETARANGYWPLHPS